MSAKNLDNKGRFRSKTVAFRVSPEEWEELEAYVRLSGLTKQDYILKRLTDKSIVVRGTPRVYKALKGELGRVYEELKRIQSMDDVGTEMLSLISKIVEIMDGMKNG